MGRRIQMGYRGDVPYKENKEYLQEQIIGLNRFLSERLHLYDGERQAMFLVRKMEERMCKKELWEKSCYQEIWEQNQSRIELSLELGRVLYLERILRYFEEKEFFRQVFLLAFLWETDEWYRQCLSILLGKEIERLTLGDVMTIFFMDTGAEHMEVFDRVSEDLGVFRIFFPEFQEGTHLFRQPVVCDARFSDYFLDTDFFYSRGTSELTVSEQNGVIFAREGEKKQLLLAIEEEEVPICLLYGEKGSGKKTLLAKMAEERGEKLLLCRLDDNADSLKSSLHAIYMQMRYALRDAIVRKFLLVLQGFEELEEKKVKEFLSFIRKEIFPYVKEIYLLYDREECIITKEGLYFVPFHSLTEKERLMVWEHYRKRLSEKVMVSEKVVLEEIANTFVMTPGQIKQAWEDAYLEAKGEEEGITQNILYHACYAQLGHPMGEKATLVKSEFTMQHLKIDEMEKKILSDICDCIRCRNRVMREWQFQRVVPYGAGITVLFAGPPGTGKTMAAQVIANELHMELYKIDLSQVIDKYVGETEKNIRRIFSQAKKSHSILFFDEGDAIFHKRLEATNSNERFANIESSLLLQCIEEYDGIAILATNHFSSIDPAFIRRFKYYLLFREPDKKIRYEIWKEVFPKEAPLSEEVDFEVLAELFELTGAVIKNVALTAAYLAAARKEEITLLDILTAVKREMYKNNLILTREKLKSLGYLYDELL